ncbi:LuxR C-terminal-related transcriptional regulator [Glaciibacter superstes]|uniref:LuxR C-terminal-related transcriptional regulator n=1 Tax=Glaciibacter superstes TaxID=501023 RepID=UPI0003B54F51|nr:LuxR C-terminal-related transcriptional regulator [Glaciibacter superstes]
MYGTPRVPRGFVARQRLHAALDADVALVVVRGAAGSGKTFAVADWVTNGGGAARQGAWHTIEAGSATRFAFWPAVIGLLTRARLLPDDSILTHSMAALGSVGELRRHLRRSFARLTDAVTIVLDDFHLVAEIGIHDDLVDVVRSSPQVRLIVVTRSRGPLESDDRLLSETVLVAPEGSSLTLDDDVLAGRKDDPAVFTATLMTPGLTKREGVVLHQLVSTGNVAAIAAALYVSTNTVKSQLRSLYRKLGVDCRQDALIAASERRLIEP